MKKHSLLLVAGLCALASGCKQEALDPVTPDEGNTIKIEVSLSEDLKGTFADLEGLKWEVGDVLWCWDNNGTKWISEPLGEEDLAGNGTVANFSFASDLIAEDRNLEFTSPNNHPSNKNEVTFTLNNDPNLAGGTEFNAFTQEEAGAINKRRLFLHNGTTVVSNKAGNTPKVNMAICGTIVRVIPYTTTHNDEKVLAIEMSTASGTKLTGTVVYDRNGGSYQSASAKNYAAYNSVKATLANPFSLEGVTSKDASKGIYLPIPATGKDESFNGYQLMVETDKAKYYFITDQSFSVQENSVKNVFVNLEKGTPASGFLHYVGSINDITSEKEVSANGGENIDLGYWKAQVSVNGNDWEDRINEENKSFYENVKFECYDPSTNQPVDWITVTYGAGDLCHWMANIKSNTGDERKAVIKATFDSVDDYVLQVGYATKSIVISQKSASAVKVLDFRGGFGENIPFGNMEVESSRVENQSIAWYAIRVDGNIIEGNDPLYDQFYGNVKLIAYSSEGVSGGEVVDWLKLSYKPKETWIQYTVEENTGAERKSLVYIEFTAPDGYEFKDGIPGRKDEKTAYMQFLFTQKAGFTYDASFEGVYFDAIPASGAEITAAKLNLSVNGVAVSDFSKLSEYGLSIKSSVGAATIATDGTVTLNVKENYSTKERTCIISLVKGTEEIASCSVKQNAGEGGSTPVYEYEIVKHNGNPTGAIFGYNVDFHVKGSDFTISNVKLNGQSVVLTEEVAQEVINQAFECVAERPAAGYDSYKFVDNGQIYPFANNVNESSFNVAIETSSDSKGYITKLSWKSSDGEELGHWFIFVP